MEISISLLTHPPHPLKWKKKIKFSPSKKAFQLIGNNFYFCPLKCQKYLEKFSLPSSPHPPMPSNTHPEPTTPTQKYSEEGWEEQPPPTPPKKVKKFYAFKVIFSSLGA